MENNCQLHSSRGILKSCDLYPKNPISSFDKIINYTISNEKIKVIYICNTAIKEFFLNLKKYIKGKFIVVSGDSDNPIPESHFTESQFQKILSSKRLIHWFCQNLTYQHPKLTNLPIGMDYHTIYNSNIYWDSKKTPLQQETELLKIRGESSPFWRRKRLVYSNFHFSLSGKYCYDRRDAMSQIDKSLIYYEPNKKKRLDNWKTQSEYTFVASPHGNGLDCHRTWEALNLGCIVIVKTSPLDPMYRGLPVLIVKEWSDINQKLLNRTIVDFKSKQFNYDKLTLNYWKDLIYKYKEYN